MTRLILLNGAPGTGKSTLARRYAEDHPPALSLDIDAIRGTIDGWFDRPLQAGLAARAEAIVRARTHLLAGHDVVVPQYLGRIEFIEQLQRLCDDVGAVFVEIALTSEASEVLRRFARRSATPENAEHRDAAALQATSDAFDLASTVDAVAAVLARRPKTRTVCSIDGAIEATYRSLLAELDH